MDTEKAPKAFRTISEVSEIIGIQPYVIRFWESQFRQIKPTRKKGGRRYYRPTDIEFLLGIKKILYEDRLTIKKAKTLILKNGKNSVTRLAQKASKAHIEKHNKEEPPLVKKGNGSPTTGIIPLTIKMFNKKLNPITNVQYVPI